ncbi:hypothetical protein LCGC14_0400930 [marine sediment metagenome]|uniref:Uncharacterized protein n=1 Tax=marine sediment metagenome TaxID=412755 RepID=A0A0F9SWW7_9ZZZZ
MKNDFFLVTELETETLTEGKTFDGLVAGDFVDMHGRRILVEEDELEDYVANTQSAIEATESESGEIVGLPIDVYDHDKEDAAGWIVGASLSDGVIRLDPKWTALGKDLIEEGIRRFFSATFNTDQQVILGGTLTNWPATRDDEGRVMLRPIELSTSMFSVERELAEEPESTEDRLSRMQADFRDQFPYFDNRPYMWIEDTFDEESFVIVDEDARHYRVEFSENDDGNFDFIDRTEWVEVKQTWIDAAKKAARDIILGGLSRRKHDKHGGRNMPKDKLTLDDLSPEEKNELALGVLAELGGEKYNPADLGAQVDLMVDQRARKIVAEETAKAERERGIAEFASRITGGDEKTPAGLPVNKEQLEAFLGSLDNDQREAATAIFDEIVTKGGLVEFTEDGHSRKERGGSPLPEEMAEQLRTYLAESKDASVAEFFEVNEDMLGPMTDYNLSEFKEKEGSDG